MAITAGGRSSTSASPQHTGATLRVSEVAEPDGLLHGGLDRRLRAREGQRLYALLAVVQRPGADPLLEGRRRGRPAGVAHVIGATPRTARVLDGPGVQEVVGTVVAHGLVHRAAEVVGVATLEPDH